MWPDRVSNPGPLTYESGALPAALRGPAAPYLRINKPMHLPLNGTGVTYFDSFILPDEGLL